MKRSSDLILLTDNRGKIFHSRSNPTCKSCLLECQVESESISGCEQGGTHRRGSFKSDLGLVYLCSQRNEMIASSKLFKKELHFYSEMLGGYQDLCELLLDEGSKWVKRLIHNLTSQHAHILQELYLLVPQEILANSTNATEQLKSVRQALNENREENQDSLALGYLNILKNAIDMKSEMNVFKHLYSENKELHEKFHPIHRVLKNVSSRYFQDLQDKSVYVKQDSCSKEVLLDYETVSVALHHIFLNAVKYTMNNSEISIRFFESPDNFRIEFEMISLPIYEKEKEIIFEDGYSGKAARQLSKAGGGWGMGVTKKLLRLNQASISAYPGPIQHQRLGISYATNKFHIEFPIKKVREQRT